MLSLDTSTRKLQLVLAGAVSTTEAAITATYEDKRPGQRGEGLVKTQVSVSNGATDVDIVDAPASGIRREVKHLSIYNRDTAAIVVTVKIDDAATETISCKFTLATLETLFYSAVRGFYVLDANGAQKTTTGTESSSAMSAATSAGLGDSVSRSSATSTGLGDSVTRSAATSAGLKNSVIQSEITSGTI